MYTGHGRGADPPFFLRFGHGPILVQIFVQILVLICGASHREAVSTTFKVFGMTQPRVD